MYIRKTKKQDPETKKSYFTYQLVESYRTERGPRQRILLSMGSDLQLPKEDHKVLANRIEEIISGQNSLIPYPQEIESLAQKYASRLIDRLSNQKQAAKQDPNKEKQEDLADYSTIDLNTIEQQKPRTVGAEHLLLEIASDLRLSEKLKECGLSPSDISMVST